MLLFEKKVEIFNFSKSVVACKIKFGIILNHLHEVACVSKTNYPLVDRGHSLTMVQGHI